MDVPFYNDRTRSYTDTLSNIHDHVSINGRLTGSPCREKHIRNLYDAFRMLFSDLKDYCGIVLVFEYFSTSHDHAPSFSNNPGASGYSNGTRDNVGSSIEEDNLLAYVLG